LEHLTDDRAIARHQTRALLILEVKTQPLGTTQTVLGYLVQAGQILNDSAAQKWPPPEITGWAIDQEKLASIVDEQIPPFQIVMSKAVIMQGACRLRHLAADVIYPAPISQARVRMGGDRGHVRGFGDFQRDQ